MLGSVPASNLADIVRFSSRRSSGTLICAQTLVLLVCLAVTVQGGHVCQYAQLGAPGVQPEMSSGAPFCTACAVAHSLLITVILLLLLLIPTTSRTVFVSVQAKSYWHGLRLYVRPPPALS